MLNAKNFSIIINIINGIIYEYINIYWLFIQVNANNIYNNIFVKIIITREQLAVVKNFNLFKNFITIQRLNARNLYIFKNKITSINDFEAYFVGLIEGDGWFSISKKGKYLLYELGIELNIKDVQLIYKLKKILGIGIVKFRKSKITNENISVIYVIRDKKNIINIILPIFDKYPMFTNKYYDYLRFKYNLLNNIILYENLDNLPETIRSQEQIVEGVYKTPTVINYIRPIEPIKNVNEILLSNYFSSWLIGFIEAEGCFSIYSVKDRNEKVASFEISQTNSYEIIQAIKIYLNISSNVYKDKFNNYRIKITSKRGIENLIIFLKQNRIKLLGNKRLQFLLFLKELRTLKRYDNINIPNIY